MSPSAPEASLSVSSKGKAGKNATPGCASLLGVGGLSSIGVGLFPLAHHSLCSQGSHMRMGMCVLGTFLALYMIEVCSPPLQSSGLIAAHSQSSAS